MKVYLDTCAVIWLSEGTIEKLSPAASAAMEASDVEISPMVLVELQYLYETKRIVKAPSDWLHRTRKFGKIIQKRFGFNEWPDRSHVPSFTVGVQYRYRTPTVKEGT